MNPSNVHLLTASASEIKPDSMASQQDSPSSVWLPTSKHCWLYWGSLFYLASSPSSGINWSATESRYCILQRKTTHLYLNWRHCELADAPTSFTCSVSSTEELLYLQFVSEPSVARRNRKRMRDEAHTISSQFVRASRNVLWLCRSWAEGGRGGKHNFIYNHCTGKTEQFLQRLLSKGCKIISTQVIWSDGAEVFTAFR